MNRAMYGSLFFGWRAGIICISLASVLSGCATVARPTHSGDLATLLNTIESAHPDPFFHESQASLDRAVALAQAELAQGSTPAHTFLVLAPLVSGIGDAHTNLDPYTTDYQQFRDHGGRLFPLELRFEGSNAIVIANYERGLPIQNGSRLLSIAGRSIPRFLKATERLTSGEQPALRAWMLSQDLRALMWLDGLRAPFDITFRNSDGRIETVRAQGCTIDAIHRWDQSAAGFGQLAPFAFHVDASTRVGILTIHSFDVDNANEWKAFLHRTLAGLKARHARALVIDVRQNSGGDTDLSDDLLRIFARTSFRDFSEVDAKISAVTKRALGHDRYIEIYGPDAWSATDGTTLIEPIAYENPLPRNARFPGKVYVLVGSGTYSTAAIFAAAAQDSHSATIVGQESGGLPTLYGEAFPFTLPESGISATVSTKYLVRADSDRRPHGVIPDKDFQETPEGQRDSELKSAVELAAGR